MGSSERSWAAQNALYAPSTNTKPHHNQVFDKFYLQEKPAAKLAWFYSLGSCSVKAQLGKKKYDLDVATLQAAALACFNEQETMTYGDLLNKLNVTPEILKPVMHSLCCGKHKVVAKDPKSSKVSKRV